MRPWGFRRRQQPKNPVPPEETKAPDDTGLPSRPGSDWSRLGPITRVLGTPTPVSSTDRLGLATRFDPRLGGTVGHARLAEAPGPISVTQDELEAHLADDDLVDGFAERYRAWRRRFNARDDGAAAQRVVARILDQGFVDR